MFSDHPAPIAVGPVRINHSSSASNKVKPHPLLFSTRPAFVTFIVLVQDALARLPNGVGTKTDICMLVKDSQYVNQVLLSIVELYFDKQHYIFSTALYPMQPLNSTSNRFRRTQLWRAGTL